MRMRGGKVKRMKYPRTLARGAQFPWPCMVRRILGTVSRGTCLMVSAASIVCLCEFARAADLRAILSLTSHDASFAGPGEGFGDGLFEVLGVGCREIGRHALLDAQFFVAEKTPEGITAGFFSTEWKTGWRILDASGVSVIPDVEVLYSHFGRANRFFSSTLSSGPEIDLESHPLRAVDVGAGCGVLLWNLNPWWSGPGTARLSGPPVSRGTISPFAKLWITMVFDHLLK